MAGRTTSFLAAVRQAPKMDTNLLGKIGGIHRGGTWEIEIADRQGGHELNWIWMLQIRGLAMIRPPPLVMNKPFPKGRIRQVLGQAAEAAATAAIRDTPLLRLISRQLRVEGVVRIAEQTA